VTSIDILAAAIAATLAPASAADRLDAHRPDPGIDDDDDEDERPIGDPDDDDEGFDDDEDDDEEPLQVSG
jgi:phosphopantothenoylcysteine synthetase/decarboxylase